MRAKQLHKPRGTSGVNIEITRLPNGLTVATDPQRTVESAALGLWFDVGTRHEDPAENGVAHLLEHMLFKGTKRRSAFDISAEIEAVGGAMNAYTGREVTAYFARVLKDDIPLAVDMIADIVQNSVFDAEELEREREVIMQELAQVHDTPDDIIFDRFQEVAFQNQPIGMPVLGRRRVISRVKRQPIVDFWRRHYGPSRCIAICAGKVEHQAFVDLCQEKLWPDGSDLPERPVQAKSRYTGGGFMETRNLEQVHLVWGFEGPSSTGEHFYASQVLSTLLGGGMSSRLFQEIREKRGLAYTIGSFASSYSDAGLVSIYAGTSPEHVDELEDILEHELHALLTQIGEDEVERSRAQLKASLLMARESTSNRAEGLASQLLIHKRVVPPEEIVAKVDAVDVKALRHFAGQMLASPRTRAMIGPND